MLSQISAYLLGCDNNCSFSGLIYLCATHRQENKSCRCRRALSCNYHSKEPQDWANGSSFEEFQEIDALWSFLLILCRIRTVPTSHASDSQAGRRGRRCSGGGSSNCVRKSKRLQSELCLIIENSWVVFKSDLNKDAGTMLQGWLVSLKRSHDEITNNRICFKTKIKETRKKWRPKGS